MAGIARPEILLIESHRDTAEALTTIMRLEGCEVLSVGTDAEALRALENGVRPCIIVLDVQAPAFEDGALRRALLSGPDGTGTPVVVLTVDRETDRQARTLKAAAVKKEALDALMRLVHEHCACDRSR